MDLFLLVISMFIAVLVSVIVNDYVPKVSTPLIQIVLGVLISIFATTKITGFDTELFLVLFIAPILFDDGFQLDKRTFWDQKGPVLSLAVGLVFALVLIVGFFTHAIVPSIPLAAAFAFAAALGPTDPVAVSALTKRVPVSNRQQVLLTGEALLNDASSLVSFQFALRAVVIGSFSLLAASLATLVSFIGGIVVGIALMFIRGLIMRGIANIGLDNPSFITIFEVITPFLVFLIASLFHVSEIIAVVTAGIMYSMSSDRHKAKGAQDSVVSESVWNTLTFSLNSIVFVMMGILLPQILPTVWVNPAIANWRLVLFVIAITLVLYAVRFIWVLFIKTNDDVRSDISAGTYAKNKLRSTLIMTLAGAKGVVTFAVAMSIPAVLLTGDPFPERELILFLASGVILLTLLAANFILPLLMPKPVDDAGLETSEAELMIEEYRKIIGALGEKRTPENEAAVNAIASKYRRRIGRLREEHDIEPQRHIDLSMVLISWETDNVIDMVASRKVNPLCGYSFVCALARARARLGSKSALVEGAKALKDCLVHFWGLLRERRALRKSGSSLPQKWPRMIERERSFSEVWVDTYKEIKRSNRENALGKIDEAIESGSLSHCASTDDLMNMKRSSENRMIEFALGSSISKLIPGHEGFIFARYSEGDDADLEDFAIRAERIAIRRLEESGKLSKESARMLRNELAMRELDLSD